VIDYNTATAQECADWLAEQDGIGPVCGQFGECRYFTDNEGVVGETLDPYPLTLDAAAGALGDDWQLQELTYLGDRYGACIHRVRGPLSACGIRAYGPDRMTAEYRAAVAARLDGMEGRG
jgi:hypothetical protein